MLGKLIGYDNRIQSKFFGGVYAVMGVLAGIAAVLKALNEHFNHVIVLQYAYQIAWVICRAAAIAVIVGSIIYVIALFRNNLLKDEGYFMHTLPVPAWQLYVSKLVTGTVWIVVSIVVVILAYMLGSLDFHLPILEIENRMAGRNCNFPVDSGGAESVLCKFFDRLYLGRKGKLPRS